MAEAWESLIRLSSMQQEQRAHLEVDIPEAVEFQRPLHSISVVDHVDCSIPQPPHSARKAVNAVMLVHLHHQSSLSCLSRPLLGNSQQSEASCSLPFFSTRGSHHFLIVHECCRQMHNHATSISNTKDCMSMHL